MSKYDAVQKCWGTLDAMESHDPKISFGKSILDLLSVYGSKVAQINDDTGNRITFNEVRLKTIRVAQNLLKLGFKPRQKLSFMAHNCDDLLPVYLASVCLACPVVPFHALLSNQEVARILTKTEPSLIFCDAGSHANIIEILDQLKLNIKVFTFGDHIDGSESVNNLLLETGDEQNFVPVHIDIKNDIAGIFCSSGTAGPSKGVCVSFDHSVFMGLNKYVENSSIFDVHAIYWTVGIKLIMESIHSGATRIITAKDLSADVQLRLIEKYKINVLNPLPFDLVSMLKDERIETMDFSYVTSICTYGYKMPFELVSDVKRFMPNATFVSSYGMTEMGQVAFCYFNSDNAGLRVVEGVQVKIINDDGNRCGPNESGEIRVKKAYKFRGYIHDATATADALDDEQYFRTGDIGYFDNNGILYFSDRKKNVLTLFYYDGLILPSEVEAGLLKVSDIKEACVVGIPIVSDANLPAALCVRQPNSKITQNDVYNIVADNFPYRCRLRAGVYFVDSLPKTHNGKLIRNEITAVAIELFQSAKQNDSDIKRYLLDIPEAYRKLI